MTTLESQAMAVYAEYYAQRLRGWMESLAADEEGQTATEYLGVIAIVVAIIGGVLTLANAIGVTIAGKILSKIAGL
jgi:Flp pilus assembly pilin Flp